MLVMLAGSTIMGVSSSSWLTIWVCLEINTVLMCAMMAKEMKKWKLQETPTFMYFLIQVVASITILVSSYQEMSTAPLMAMVVALLMKMGAWPTHVWYMKLISSMEMKQLTMLVIMSWQKIMPVVFISSLMEKTTSSPILWALVVLTLTVPLANLTASLSMKSILAISSFNNNGWLLAAALTAPTSFWAFLSLYTATLTVTLVTMKMITMKSMKLNLPFWVATLTIGNMGGLPPMAMFWAKVLVVKSMILWAPTELLLLLMGTACYLLYHYLWLALNEMTHSPVKVQTPASPNTLTKISLAVTTLSMAGLMLTVSLGLT